MGIIVPFTGGWGGGVFDMFGLMSTLAWHPVEGRAFYLSWWALVSWYEWPLFAEIEQGIHNQSLWMEGSSWGPLVLWAHQLSSHCFGLLFPVARNGVERQARVWLSLEYKVMSGEMEDGFSGSWQPSLSSWVPGECLGQFHWARSLHGPCWVCVTSAGYVQKWRSSIHFITLTWFQICITHMEWASEFFHD